jgi:hypothetical protein
LIFSLDDFEDDFAEGYNNCTYRFVNS